jgi:hypothetical protein
MRVFAFSDFRFFCLVYSIHSMTLLTNRRVIAIFGRLASNLTSIYFICKTVGFSLYRCYFVIDCDIAAGRPSVLTQQKRGDQINRASGMG